ncbi:MAG: peptidyl-prolyl cis-trans isomerase [Phycisphaerae bacterium]|nr:peptidyl-prolyl cis-trans isomerase [Phycisphaerae bacterium]
MSDTKNPKIELKTSKGIVILELDAENAPVSTANFVEYVQSGHYDGTIFHRVIDNFMVQGGGFTKDMTQKKTNKPIQNESDNGLKNDCGTVAMARTADLHSATCQFFINVKDNDFLNYPSNGGYAVFGKVVEGMDIVEAIKAVKTVFTHGMQDVPKEAVVIESATLL